MAACIAGAHSKWDERPLLVVEKTELTLSEDEIKTDILKFFEGKIAH